MIFLSDFKIFYAILFMCSKSHLLKPVNIKSGKGKSFTKKC